MENELSIAVFEESFLDSLDGNLKDALLDIGEMTLDEVIDSGTLAPVPLLGLIIGVGKTAINVHNRNLFNQVLSFLRAFCSGEIDEDTLREHRELLDNDPKRRERETGFVLTIINRNIQESRSEMQGNLYRAYLNKEFGWIEFVELSEVAATCVISDLTLLRDVQRGVVEVSDRRNGYRVDRLAGLGLVQRSVKAMVSNGDLTWNDYFLSMSPFGEQFCAYALNAG